MAGKGRPRKPKDRKIIQGTFRSDRNPKREPDPPPVETVPRPPSNLNRYAKRFWKRLAQLLVDDDLLTVLDFETLEMCCAAYGQYREMQDAIYRPADPVTGRRSKRTLGEYLEGRNSQTMPEYMAMKAGYQLYKSYMAEFGLSPATRNRIDLPEPKKSRLDAMEDLINAD